MTDHRNIPVDHHTAGLQQELAEHWRDASQLMPPDYKLVLGTEVGHCKWFVCYRDATSWVRRGYERDVWDVVVTHWMPLPNLPTVSA